jgi:hypothetical protein
MTLGRISFPVQKSTAYRVELERDVHFLAFDQRDEKNIAFVSKIYQ